MKQKFCRPLDHLRAASCRWPMAWRQYGLILAGRGQDVPDWPDWCYCPMAAAHAIISGGVDAPYLDSTISALAALAAWRMSKTVYRFDQDLYAALETTRMSRIPREILYRLPQWCVYIESQGWLAKTAGMAGFFCHLEWDVKHERPELRLLLDLAGGTINELVPVPIHLTQDTLTDGLRSMWD